MKISIKIAVAVYLIVMIGCVFAFFVQRSVVYGDHIRPGREHSKSPVVVQLKDRQSGAVREAELTFVNDSVVTNPLRMGNEIEEHLQSLLVANLATGLLILFVVFNGVRRAQPSLSADG